MENYTRGHNLPRINIGPDARKYHSLGYVRDLKTDPIIERTGIIRKQYKFKEPKSPKEALEVWKNSQPERFALDAVLINRVIDRALDDRAKYPPYGLVSTNNDVTSPLHEFPEDYSFIQMQTDFKTTLGIAFKSEMNELDLRLRNNEQSAEISVYDRALYWANYFYKYVPHVENGFFTSEINPNTGSEVEGTPHPFIIKGSGGASGIEVPRKLVEVISDISEFSLETQELTPALYLEIAKNSYSVVAQLASKDHLKSNLIESFLGDFGRHFVEFLHNPKYKVDSTSTKDFFNFLFFEIIKGPHGNYLKLNLPSVFNDFMEQGFDTHLTPYQIETGCPAVTPIEGDAATKKLYMWIVDVYGDYIKKFWDTKFKPSDERKRELELKAKKTQEYLKALSEYYNEEAEE